MLGMTLCRVARISVSVSVSYKRRSSLFIPFCNLHFEICTLHYALLLFPLRPRDLRSPISHLSLRFALCAMRFSMFFPMPSALCSLRLFIPLAPSRLGLTAPTLWGATYVLISLYYIFPALSSRVPPGISDGRFQGSLSSFAGSSCPPKPRFHNPSRCNPRRCGRSSPPHPV